MKWDIRDHQKTNRTVVSWANGPNTELAKNHYCIVDKKLSAMFILNKQSAGDLHHFAHRNDEGEDAFSYRWHITITNLPENARTEHRSVQATFYCSDNTDEDPCSVLDGSTFGEVSIFEVNPPPSDTHDIVLVVDFTKVGNQNHQFGIHVLITHGIQPIRV